MSRPIKEGLDYFPHDTDASHDEKVETLTLLYDSLGYHFYFYHLERIYRTNNAELDISAAETRQILSKKLGINETRYNEILETCLKHGCFDANIYHQKGILTSNGIKKRAMAIIDKRNKMRELYHNNISAAETTEGNKGRNDISKEKERKEKEDIYIRIFEHWNSKNIVTHRILTDKIKRKIVNALMQYKEEEIQTCINNYDHILKHPEQFYFGYKWTLEDFLHRGFEKFKNADVAKKNYAKKEM